MLLIDVVVLLKDVVVDVDVEVVVFVVVDVMVGVYSHVSGSHSPHSPSAS